MLPHADHGVSAPAETGILSACLADHAPVYLEGLSHALTEYSALHVAYCTGDGDDLLRYAMEQAPGAVLISLDLPPAGGMQVVRSLRRSGVESGVVLYGDWHLCAHVLTAHRLGVLGMVSRDDPCEQFIRAAEQAARGRTYLSPSVQVHLTRGWRTRRHDCRVDELTATEFQVLSLLSGSLTSSAIAEVLCISARTVEKHRQNIGRKLNLHGSNALLSFAVNNADSLRSMAQVNQLQRRHSRGEAAMQRRMSALTRD